MKRLTIAVLICFLSSVNLFSQWSMVTSAPEVYQQDIVNIDGRLILSTAGSGIYESDDGGETWITKNNGLNSPQALVVYQVLEYNSMMFAATTDGIYKSTDSGGNWVKKSSGITIGPGAIYEFTQSIFEYNDILLTGAWNGIYYSADAGENWSLTNVSGEAVLAENITEHNNILFAAREVNNSPIGYRSTDGGINWEPITGLSFFSIITFFSEPPNLWAGTIAGTWLSTDNGITWEDRSNGLTADPYSSSLIRVNGVLMTALKFGGSGVFRSFDDGLNWENFSEGLPFLNSIDRLIEYNGKLLAATSNGLWQRDVSEIPVELTSFTASAGKGFIKLSWSTSTETNNKGFEVQRKEKEGKWNSVTFIQGKGTTTEPEGYSYKDVNVSDGVYLYRLKQVDYEGSFELSPVVEVNYNSPEQFSLNQNYPNPFNPSSYISFTLGKTSFVSLRVYDALGKEVRVLMNEQKTAGSYNLNFNGDGLSAGVYYYKLTAGNFNKVRKMILLK